MTELDRIKADVETFCPIPKRTKKMSDDQWDDILAIVGNQRISYQMGATAEAVRAMKLVEALGKIKDNPYPENIFKPLTQKEFNVIYGWTKLIGISFDRISAEIGRQILKPIIKVATDSLAAYSK